MSVIKRNLKVGKHNEGFAMQHTEDVDDNFLPKAAEIEALHKIDNSVLPWLMQMSEREQKFRHESYYTRVDITDNHSQREHNTARCALIIYFVLVIICITASFLLVREGHSLQGTLFGGTAVVLGLAVLIARSPNRQGKQNIPPPKA